MNNEDDVVITTRKIGKTVYTIVARHSENAKDTLHTKIEKLLKRDVEREILNEFHPEFRSDK